MKTVIFGSRSFAKVPDKYAKRYQKNPYLLIQDYETYESEYLQLVDLINTFQFIYGEITEVISGTAIGMDQAGERWALENEVKIKRFKPNWTKDGKKAGFLRNVEMCDECDSGIAVIVNGSKGSSHTVREMNKRKKPLIVKEIEND